MAAGWRWGDPVAGLAITAFICHVGWEVTADVTRRLADGIDPEVITAAEAAADELGRQAAAALSRQLPEAASFTWATRAAPD